jgi:succinate-acetate transporter protein
MPPVGCPAEGALTEIVHIARKNDTHKRRRSQVMQTRHRISRESDGIAATATIAEALRIVRTHHGDPVQIREGNDVVGIVAQEDAAIAPPARVVLQPIAAPSILGLYGFAGATLIVAANMAGWYGSPTSALFLFPFAAFFGGLAQFMAGMWGFRARDGLATAMHGMWGAFWMGYGLLNLLFATGTLTEPAGAFPELGWWFVALAAITWVGAVAALAENWVLTGVLGFLAAGATVAAGAFISNNAGWETVAGWLFVVAAVIAWYLASAMMLAGTYKRSILPLGKYTSVEPHPVQYLRGHPGVKVGQ